MICDVPRLTDRRRRPHAEAARTHDERAWLPGDPAAVAAMGGCRSAIVTGPGEQAITCHGNRCPIAVAIWSKVFEEHCRDPRDPGKLWHRLIGASGGAVSESGRLHQGLAATRAMIAAGGG